MGWKGFDHEIKNQPWHMLVGGLCAFWAAYYGAPFWACMLTAWWPGIMKEVAEEGVPTTVPKVLHAFRTSFFPDMCGYILGGFFIWGIVDIGRVIFI